MNTEWKIIWTQWIAVKSPRMVLVNYNILVTTREQCKLFSIQSRNNLAVYNNKEWLLSSESLIFVTNKLNAV